MEKPNFETIARSVAKRHADRYDEDGDGNLVGLSADEDQLTSDIAEQLRLMWNARGGADIAAIEASLSSQMGVTASGPYVKNLDRALRALDVE